MVVEETNKHLQLIITVLGVPYTTLTSDRQLDLLTFGCINS